MTSHLGLTPEESAEQGINERLLRMSVGIEAPDDLFVDLAQALEG
jgi:cystathionine beta-lyase/cystathionine gamma-synthase